MRSRLPWLALGALLGLTILGPMVALSGQTRMDAAITRLAGSPFTELYDLDARIDTLEAGVPGTEVSYTAVDANWSNPDPTEVDGALDAVASDLVYAAGDVTDWSGGVDPGRLTAAMDQAADRITALEAGVPADEVTYTPAQLTDWDGNADPGDADAALDQLAERIDDAELSTGIGYTPADSTAWADPDPTAVNGALDDLALTRQRLRIIETSVGAEAADVVLVTVTVTNGAGGALSSAVRLKVSIYEDEVLDDVADQAAFTLGDGGDGSLLFSAAANAVYIFETSAAGVAVIAVTDVATASGLTRHLKIEHLHTTSPGQTWGPGALKQSVTFDGF